MTIDSQYVKITLMQVHAKCYTLPLLICAWYLQKQNIWQIPTRAMITKGNKCWRNYTYVYWNWPGKL